MASTRKMRTRGKRSIGFFADLNSISVADFCSESKPRRRTVDSGRFFEVERIISSREGQQVSLFFLVGELTRNVGKKVSISL